MHSKNGIENIWDRVWSLRNSGRVKIKVRRFILFTNYRDYNEDGRTFHTGLSIFIGNHPGNIMLHWRKKQHCSHSQMSQWPCIRDTCWYMMTSSNGNIFRVTGHLCEEFTSLRWIPRTTPVTRSFDVFFDLCLNRRLSKQPWGWWFKTLSRPLWRHRHDMTGCIVEMKNTHFSDHYLRHIQLKDLAIPKMRKKSHSCWLRT